MAVLKIICRLSSAARYFIEVLICGPDGGEPQESGRTKSSSLLIGCYCGFSRLDAVSCIGASGLYDVKKIGEWAAQSRLDPNDPKNTSIMQLLKVGDEEEGTPDNSRSPSYPDMTRLPCGCSGGQRRRGDHSRVLPLGASAGGVQLRE